MKKGMYSRSTIRMMPPAMTNAQRSHERRNATAPFLYIDPPRSCASALELANRKNRTKTHRYTKNCPRRIALNGRNIGQMIRRSSLNSTLQSHVKQYTRRAVRIARIPAFSTSIQSIFSGFAALDRP